MKTISKKKLIMMKILLNISTRRNYLRIKLIGNML